jgi:hypothetical protein
MSARNNARKKAGDVHGIAAAFGGAKDIFNSALSKGSGNEMSAMFSKTANDNQKDHKSSNNFGKSTQSPATSSVAPFRPKQRPGEEISGGVSNNFLNKNSSPSELVKNTFSGQDLSKTANDNQARTTINSETGAKKTQEPEVRDIRRLDQRVQDAIGTPELLPKEASANLSGQLAESISDPTKIRDKDSKEGLDPQNEYLNSDNDNENFDNSEIEKFNQQLESSRLEIESQRDSQKEEDEEFINKVRNELAKEKIDLTDDEIRGLISSNFKVKFPYIMFSVCVMFEIGTLLLALVSIVLTFILLPMGLIIGAISAISSAVMSLIVFAWTYYFVHNASDFVKKIPMMKRFLIRMMFKRGWIMLAKLIPILGSFLPIQSFMVYMTYENMKKVALKVEKIVRS